MDLFKNPPTIRNPSRFYSGWATWWKGNPQPLKCEALENAGPFSENTPVRVADIAKKSWMATHPPEFLAASPAVVKPSPHMSPDLLLSIFGDAIGHGSGKVEFNEDAQWLDSVANASFRDHVFDAEGYKKKAQVRQCDLF